jgi:hypothetical protein
MFPSPITRGVNLVAMLVSASSIPGAVTVSATLVVRLRSINKHFWHRCEFSNDVRNANTLSGAIAGDINLVRC